MYNENYFKTRVRRFYEEVDKSFRTIGCEACGSQDIYFRLSRVATPTVEYSEIKRICADVDAPATSPDDYSGHRRWPAAWGRAVQQHKDIAEYAEKNKKYYTAGLNYIRASLLAHSGQLFSRPEWPEKLSLQKERASCYRKAAPYLGIKAYQIPYGDGNKIPAYLWLPDNISNPPLVIMAPGANSVKEELHRWAPAFVARGMATLTFDGMGQGELTPLQGSSLPMRLEKYHTIITTLIDFIEENAADLVDIKRIALWGQSMGGHVITRALRYEKRPVAAVNLGGAPDLFSYPFLPPDVQEEMRDLMGFKTFEETWNYIQENSNSLQDATYINVPYLLVHGSRDDLIGDEGMKQTLKAIGDTAEMVVYKDGNHGVFNWDFIMTDMMADWLLDKLSL